METEPDHRYTRFPEFLFPRARIEQHQQMGADAPPAQSPGEQDELFLRTPETQLADQQAYARGNVILPGTRSARFPVRWRIVSQRHVRHNPFYEDPGCRDISYASR
ncbi:hypothetical protein GCM10010508_63450 [Streptomyces naganishii JCM 4654]|uniref:Uncharacterized protein n=1 Tax=Streptomyces naganishii JCM 4654 TaxID=1306179 RepID=A0A919D0B3_9ACTN|nr:hypothetical protein GCM10010508_63450 [Streptomyces naganishii JCM 4654]